jgi:ATP synthase F1 complex assembly factor 1
MLSGLRSVLSKHGHRLMPHRQTASFSSFSWTGPRALEDIIKKELLVDKTADEVSAIWLKYHEEKDAVHGTTLKGSEGINVLERAKESPFFIQPVFRDDGFFMLVSQYQADHHFLMAYLEDYKMDPARASPLLTFSLFADYADELDLTLVRTDVVNNGVLDEEALKVVVGMLDAYRHEDEYEQVRIFNQAPDQFDIDDYISRQNQRWKVGVSANENE